MPKPHPGREGTAVLLAPLTSEQALRAALQVKPADVAKQEAWERTKKGAKKKRGR